MFTDASPAGASVVKVFNIWTNGAELVPWEVGELQSPPCLTHMAFKLTRWDQMEPLIPLSWAEAHGKQIVEIRQQPGPASLPRTGPILRDGGTRPTLGAPIHLASAPSGAGRWSSIIGPPPNSMGAAKESLPDVQGSRNPTEGRTQLNTAFQNFSRSSDTSLPLADWLRRAVDLLPLQQVLEAMAKPRFGINYVVLSLVLTSLVSLLAGRCLCC